MWRLFSLRSEGMLRVPICGLPIRVGESQDDRVTSYRPTDLQADREP